MSLKKLEMKENPQKTLENVNKNLKYGWNVHQIAIVFNNNKIRDSERVEVMYFNNIDKIDSEVAKAIRAEMDRQESPPCF